VLLRPITRRDKAAKPARQFLDDAEEGHGGVLEPLKIPRRQSAVSQTENYAQIVAGCLHALCRTVSERKRRRPLINRVGRPADQRLSGRVEPPTTLSWIHASGFRGWSVGLVTMRAPHSCRVS
jgi:hypothetical protein